MRLFTSYTEARSEIERDLAKSPTVGSTRVQARVGLNQEAHEAMNYAYTLTYNAGIPTHLELGAMARKFGVVEDNDEAQNQWVTWILTEFHARTTWLPDMTTEIIHPELKEHLEGATPAYTYTDRLAGMLDTLIGTVQRTPDTRRAFWPMFTREDAVRAPRPTRIPCTLGYQLLIREVVAGKGPHLLHMTYLQRSCDFQKFWLSDLWLAHMLQRQIYENLISGPYKTQFYDLKMGALSHIILSLHSFIEGEIY